MKKLINRYSLLGCLIVLALFSFSKTPETIQYKCMIQMTNYTGEGAYVVVSLMNPDGSYNETLYVNGDDDEWYFDITEWWKFYGKRRTSLDAITGATISGGQRSMCVLNIDKEKINKGYKIRFETAVEDQEYHANDVEAALNDELTSQKITGKGFIRYVRLMSKVTY